MGRNDTHGNKTAGGIFHEELSVQEVWDLDYKRISSKDDELSERWIPPVDKFGADWEYQISVQEVRDVD